MSLTRRMPVVVPAVSSCIYRIPIRVCGFLLPHRLGALAQGRRDFAQHVWCQHAWFQRAWLSEASCHACVTHLNLLPTLTGVSASVEAGE